jgi:hypothetical protein
VRGNLVAAWRENIVGHWQPELYGVDLLCLGPTAGRFDAPLLIRPDGTWGQPGREETGIPPDLPARLRWPWELADDRVLSLWTPVPPMPEFHLPEWSRQEQQWLVLAVTGLSLALADSHQTVVFRRVDREDYDRRKAAEYGRVIETVRRAAGGGSA